MALSVGALGGAVIGAVSLSSPWSSPSEVCGFGVYINVMERVRRYFTLPPQPPPAQDMYGINRIDYPIYTIHIFIMQSEGKCLRGMGDCFARKRDETSR